MVRRVAIVSLLSAVMLLGCSDQEGGSASRQESASARAQCEREAETNEPPGVRGTLAGAFETTRKAVDREHRRLYDKEAPSLGNPSDEPLALCYYDVSAEQTAVIPPGKLGPVERVSIVIDVQLNSLLLHGGPKRAVPVRAID